MEVTEFTGQMHQIAADQPTGDADFEARWRSFLKEFREWTSQSSVQNISLLNVKLAFLQMLLNEFPALGTLKTDPRVLDLVLAGCRGVGDKFAHPRYGECEIVRRSIGDKFGILYTLKTANAKLVSFEFLD
jgi:hypothetical protein